MIKNPGCYSCKYLNKSIYIDDVCECQENIKIKHGYAYDYNTYIRSPRKKNRRRNCVDFEEK